MQLVIQDGQVWATHEDHQDIAQFYPDSEIVTYRKPLPLPRPGEPWLPFPDPRTSDERHEAYRDKRRLAYPSIEDQLDMIYQDQVNGTTTWQDAIAAVKVKYPKP